MDDVKSEKQKFLDALWAEKEAIRRNFQNTDLSEIGDIVFLNGCWTFRPKPPLHKGSLGLDLGLTAERLKDIGKAEREELSEIAAEKANQAYRELVESKRSEIDKYVGKGNATWGKFVELKKTGVDERIVANSQMANTRRIVPINELMGNEGDKPRIIIDSLLSKTWIGLLAGASKSNKTWLALHLALAVSKGEEWLGFKCNPSRVLYIDYELSVHSMRKRMSKMGLLREEPSHGPDFLMLKGGGRKNEVARILKLIRESHRQGKPDSESKQDAGGDNADEEELPSIDGIYDLIVIDPFYMLLGNRDENSASDIIQVFEDVRKLQSATGAAVLINTHFKKGARDYRSNSTDRISGSGVYARYPDVIMTLERLDEGVSQKLKEKLRNRYRIDFTVRHLRAPEPKGLRFDPITCRFSALRGDEVKPGKDLIEVKPARRGRKSKADKLIMGAMKSNAKNFNGMPLAKVVPSVAEAANVGTSTVYRFLKNKTRYVYRRGNKLYIDLSKYEK